MAGLLRISFAGRLTAAIAVWPVALITWAGPAVAAEAYTVRITSLPDRFQTGDQGSITSVSATRQAAGCSRIRMLMLITLQGIDYGDLKVEVRTASGWEISPISRAGDHMMRAEDNWIDVNPLCQSQERALQHRIIFLAGAPTGSALIDVVVSSHGDSAEAGRSQATRPVVAAAAAPSTTRGKTPAAPTATAVAVAVAASPTVLPTGASNMPVSMGAALAASPRPASAVLLFIGGGVGVLPWPPC